MRLSRRVLVMRLATLLFCLSIMVPPVAAANGQGLAWAVTAGDRYDYSISTRSYFAGLYDKASTERAYTIIDDVPELPTTVSNLIEVGFVHGLNRSSYYENGTPLPMGLNFIWHALPIGNWSLMTDMFAEQMFGRGDDLDHVTWIDTATLWGFNFTEVGADLTVVYAETFVKSIGVQCKYLTYYIVDFSDGVSITRTEITYLGAIGGEYDTLIVVGIGAAVAVGLVGVILFLRRR